MLKKRLVMVCVSAFVLGGSVASGGLIKVMQESTPWLGDFESNVLGYIESYATAGTLQDFYQYGNPVAASFNGPEPALTSQRSDLFVVDGSDGTGLFVVHDKPNDGSGGSLFLEFRQYVDDILVPGGGAAFDVIQPDDPDDPDDHVYLHSGSLETDHFWGPDDTDGIALGTPDGNWSMVVHVKNDPDGIDSWVALGPGADPINLDTTVGRRVKLAAVELVVAIDVDIRPGACPNPLNVRANGILPVAIPGTPDLDVAMIDPASIRLLEDIAAVRSSYEDVTSDLAGGAEDCQCAATGQDGYYMDLVLKFRVQDIVAKLGEVADGDERMLPLTGELYDGTSIEGQDCIVIIKKGKFAEQPPGQASADEVTSQQAQADVLPACHPDYDEWLAVGQPACWANGRQCHGDIDGQPQGNEKSGFYYVGPSDLHLLMSVWLVKEPPHGPGIASVANGICADLDHQADGNAKTGYHRVGPADLSILVANCLVKEPPQGPGVPADCLDCP